jgi:hypothetical protein
VKAIDLVSKHRAGESTVIYTGLPQDVSGVELSLATGEFAQMVGDLSTSDVGKQLSLSFAGLAEVERTAQDLQNTQSEQDIATIMNTGIPRTHFGCDSLLMAFF